MVKLDRIYTKTGDAGLTGLGDGKRVSKDAARVEAYGTVDEANAALGVAAAIAAREAADAPADAPARELADLLRSVQHDLFDLGADLCCPMSAGETAGEKLRITPGQTQRLERAIDLHNRDLAALNSFVLPGGSTLAAALHVARTVARRAERRVVSLRTLEPAATNPEAVKHLNRLSDLLFVLSRVANGKGTGDVLWVPGANRPK